MAGPTRVVHYLNQFFGGVGGEEQANLPVEAREGPVGPARALQQLLGERGTVVATIVCGDNYINERMESALSAVKKALSDARPDVVVAGPAFDAGRYGLACGAVCKAAREMGIPAVTAMHPENPGVLSHRRDVIIAPTGSSPAEMKQALSRMAVIAMKLADGLELGLPAEEGYIPQGLRRPVTREEPGFKRAVDMLTAKLKGLPFESEVPFQQPEQVEPAAPIAEMGRATVALISTGGLIPKGNPDRQTSGNPDRYFTYSVEGVQALTGEDWEAFHGGYYNQISSDNPNYVVPLSFLRTLEADGVVGKVHPQIITLPGVSTPVDKARRLGTEIARELAGGKVDGCILVAT
jgi:glycine reductase